MKEKILDFLMSSTGEGVSLRLKAAFGVISAVAMMAGIVIKQEEFDHAAEVVGQIIAFAGVLVSAWAYYKGKKRHDLYEKMGQGRFKRV